MTAPMTAGEYLDAMRDAANAVAAFTGLRQQLVDAGWSAEHAELLVIEMVKAGNR